MSNGPVVRYTPPQQAVTVAVPQVYSNNVLDNYLNRKRAESDTRYARAYADKVQAATDVAKRQTELVVAHAERQRQLLLLQELPEVAAHELEVRRIARTEIIAQRKHDQHVNLAVRSTELAELSTRLLQAQSQQVNAQQQLDSQREHGKITYDIMHKTKQAELLDLQLDNNDRRSLLRGGKLGDEIEKDTDSVLAAYRDQLATAGLDTAHVDELIRQRKK